MVDPKLLQGEVQRLDTKLREEQGRAKTVIEALAIISDEVREHANELDRARRALTTLHETLVGELTVSRNGHEVEQRALNA